MVDQQYSQPTISTSYLNGFATTERPQRSNSDYVRSTSSRTGVSPLALSIAIHYLTRSDAEYAADDQRHWTSAPVQEAIAQFLDYGLLDERKVARADQARYVGTDGLAVWIRAVCSVPFPVRETRWVMPEAGR